MPTQQQLQDAILSAQLLSANKTETNRLSLQSGNLNVSWNLIHRLNFLSAAALRQYNLQDYTSINLTKVYDCLLSLLGIFSGSGVDPNYQSPSATVTIVFITMPPPVEITTTQMTLSGTRYDNPLWAALNPFMVVDNLTWLQNIDDYTLLATGGFVLNPTGNFPVLYPGQIIRALTYQLA